MTLIQLLDWEWPIRLVKDGDGLPIRTRQARPIQAVWGVGCHRDFGDSSDEYFRHYLAHVNALLVIQVSEQGVESLREIVDFPKRVFPGWPGYLSAKKS